MQKKKSPFVLQRTVPIKYVMKPIDLKRSKNKLKTMFTNSTDLEFRQVGDRFMIAYLFSVVNAERLEQSVIAPLKDYLLEENEEKVEQNTYDVFHRVFTTSGFVMERKWTEIAKSLTRGNVVVFEKGGTKTIILPLLQIERRAVMEPESEKTIRGPREGFIEDVNVNMGLLRKKMSSPSLVFEKLEIGSLTETKVVMAYIKGVCDPEIIQEVRDRLSFVHIQGVLDTGYLEEFLIDHPKTPMPQTEHTEKPDKLLAGLLEGRVGILVNGTPNTLMVPTVFTQFIQASEDFYENYWYASALRFIRMVAMVIVLFLPGFWIALVTMHQEMLPTALTLTLAGAREGVPFPTAVEIFFMEVAFEFLREAGLRLPAQIGPAVSIVGALIIGQSAVEAGLVSPSLVVVVALSGIASFIIPAYRLSIGLRLLRFVVLIVCAMLGLVGLVLIGLLLIVHLASMQSYGTPYFQPIAPFKFSQLSEFAIRKSWQEKSKEPYNIGIERQRNKVSPENPPVTEKGNYRK